MEKSKLLFPVFTSSWPLTDEIRILFFLSSAFQDINAYNGEEPTEKLPFPIIDDKNRDLAILLGMLDPAEKDEKGMPVTARVVSALTGTCPPMCSGQLEETGPSTAVKSLCTHANINDLKCWCRVTNIFT